MSGRTYAQAWDIMLAQRDIARHRGTIPPHTFAERRLAELRACPWFNRNDWLGRVEAYDRIVKGKIHYAELRAPELVASKIHLL